MDLGAGDAERGRQMYEEEGYQWGVGELQQGDV